MDHLQPSPTSIDLLEIKAAALKAAANGIVITDQNGTIVWANLAVSKLTGYPLEELIGRKTSLFNSGIHDKDFYHEMWQTIQSGAVWRGHMINRKKDGSLYHEEMTITPIKNKNGKIVNYFAVKEDVTAIRAAQEKLKASEERFRRLISSVHAHFYMAEYTPDGKFINYYISDSFESLTGYPNERFREDWRFWSSIVHPDDQPKTEQAIQKILSGISSESEYRIIRKDGSVIWVGDNAQVTRDPDGRLLISATIIDITDRKETENHIRFLATHDPLTELPNRILFQQVLEHSLQYSKRNQQKLAVFFLDVDNFKSVNDNYGHHIGDELLKSIGNRLSTNLREYDTIARMSGDEFTLIGEQIKTIENAKILAAKVHGFVSGKYQLHEHMVTINVSVGGAIFPDHGEEYSTLLQKADAAMYEAKKSPNISIKICGED